MSEDPIGFKGGDVNFYRYVLNSPITLTDPDGLRFRTCTRPLSFMNQSYGKIHHAYLEFDDGTTFSFGPSGNPLSDSPSVNTSENGANSSCTEYSRDSSRDEELKRRARERFTRNYNLFNYNCQDYVRDVIGN